MKKTLTRVLGVILALALVLSFATTNIFAAKASFNPPTKPTTVDKNQITVAAHSQAYISPEVLGLTNTTSRFMELPPEFGKTYTRNVMANLAYANSMAVLGVFGSDINENPNPYLYNYYYNCYAADKDLEPAAFGTYTLSSGITGSPMSAAVSGGYNENGTTVPASLYLRPDILLGVDPVSGEKTGYTEAIAVLPENTDDDKTNDYDPKQIVYAGDHVFTFLQSLYEMADAAEEIKAADSSKTTRYEDPAIIAGNVEKYVKGLQAYVHKQIRNDKTELKTVAVVDTAYTKTLMDSGAIKAGQYVVNTKDCSTQSTTRYSRVAEFVADVSNNIVDIINANGGNLQMQEGASTNSFENKYYVVTADQIAEYADVVLFCDVLSSIPENSGSSAVLNFRQDLSDNTSKGVDNIEMLTVAFDCVGSVGANSVENLLGMAYYTAYLYPQYLNQFDVAAYWYQHFYHVSDLSALKSVMATNFADSSIPTEYAKQYSPSIPDYSSDDVEARIVDGMNYYDKNADSFKNTLIYQNGRTQENTGWDIDWTKGIGAKQQDTDIKVLLTADKTSVAPDTVDMLTATAEGGDGNYTYKFIVHNNDNDTWYKLQDYTKDANTFEWNSGCAGNKTLYVDVIDGNGTQAERAGVDIKVAADPLEITDFTSSKGQVMNLGDYSDLTAQAKGGVGSYQYKFIIHNLNTDGWYKIQDWSSSNTCHWYTGNAGYDKVLFVDVRDASGNTVRRRMDIKVGSSVAKGLTSSKGDNISANTETTLTATADGGTQYKFIVHNNTTDGWYKIQDWSSSNTCAWNSGIAGDKTLYVDVQSAKGTVRIPLSVVVK